jgi:hypothetical protein
MSAKKGSYWRQRSVARLVAFLRRNLGWLAALFIGFNR